MAAGVKVLISIENEATGINFSEKCLCHRGEKERNVKI
jgi:hypothetical protein